MIYRPEHYFELTGDPVEALFADLTLVWEALDGIGDFVSDHLATAGALSTSRIEGEVHALASVAAAGVWIQPGAVVEMGAQVLGPTVVCAGARVRQGAYVRGSCWIGAEALVGHATEVKNALLLPRAKAPHFNYVGDSILGRRTNLGAGTKISNVKIARGTVKVRGPEGQIVDTGLRKFGAIVGDGAQTGCNSVLNPGSLLAPGAMVYPCALTFGYVPPDAVVKSRRDAFRTVPPSSRSG